MTSTPPPGAPDGGPAAAEYRPGGVRVLAVGWWLLSAFLVVDLLRRGAPTGAGLLGLAVVLLGCAVVHALFWQPRVRVDATGAELVNVLRVARLPWAAVTDVDTRWALTLEAGGRRFTSWAAPASGRRVRPVSRRETPWADPGATAIAGSRAPGSSAGEAAVLVGNAWQAWREQPNALRRAQAGEPVSVRWNPRGAVPLAAAVVLLLAAVLLVLPGA